MTISKSFTKFLVAHNVEIIFLGILFITSAVLRFSQLGYSHFYGDETKTIYWNKTIPASKFLLNQRKGPLQFVVVWSVEKIFGTFDEAAVRFPFAMAGFLTVGVLYLLVRKLFNWKIALISAFLFSFNGFFVAFSRTAQYQSFMLLFSLLSIYLYFLSLEKKNNLLCFASASSWIIAFNFHYDAIFYLIPILFSFIYYWRVGKTALKNFLIFFVAPVFISLCIFFAFYIYGGFFADNTLDYLTRRITGKNYSPNNSFYTISVYNPFVVSLLLLLAPLLTLFTKASYKRDLLLIWFLIPFLTFQLVVNNPGTHILNYILPALILVGYTASMLIDMLKSEKFKILLVFAYSLILASLFLVSAYIYIPSLNTGFPWKNTNIGPLKLSKANKNYNLFLYGFPYNRGWNEIRQYMLSLKGVRGVYTNDNDTIASYYLKEIAYTIPGLHFLPQYYIKVVDNQELQEDIPQMQIALPESYIEVKRVYFDDKLSAIIYKNLNYVPVVMQ